MIALKYLSQEKNLDVLAVLVDTGGFTEGDDFADEIRSQVQKAIDDLPEDLRTAIILRELEGMSYEEIAQAMDWLTD